MRWLLFFFFIPALSSFGQARLDSLKALLREAEDMHRFDRSSSFFSHIGYHFLSLNQYDSALLYYRKSLAAEKKSPAPILAASAMNSMGAIFNKIGYTDSSSFYYNKALAIYKELKDDVSATSLEINLAIIYKDKGLYEKALEMAFDAINKLEKEKPDKSLGACYNTVGNIYLKIDDTVNALIYFSKSLQVRIQINYEKGIGQSYNNIGQAYIELHRYDSALINLNRAIQMKRKIQDSPSLGATLSLVGEVYLNQGDLKKAEPYFTEALYLKKQSGERPDEAMVLNNLGKLELKKGNWKKAEQYLNQAEVLLREIGNLDNLRQNLEVKIQLYKKLNQLPKAIAFSEELILIKDSLLNKDKAESLIALQTRYETEKKEQHIKLLEQDKLVQQAEIKSKQGWIATLIIATVFIIVIALLIFIGYRISQRNRHKVEMLLKELHHRVKNNLQILSSILSLQSLHLTDADAIQAIKSSESRVNTMALIHKKLYKDESNRTIDIHEYITELSSFLLHSYGYSAQTLTLTITGEGIHVDVDKAIPIGLILNELISNALKYAYPEQADPRLDIHFQLLTFTELKIELRDNGKGMIKSENNDDTGSFGLKMVNTLIKELKGKITIATQQGTAYTLQLPLHHG